MNLRTGRATHPDGAPVQNDSAVWEHGLLVALLADGDLGMHVAGLAVRTFRKQRILEQCAHHWLSALDRLLEAS